jgi:hypothetical protein
MLNVLIIDDNVQLQIDLGRYSASLVMRFNLPVTERKVCAWR